MKMRITAISLLFVLVVAGCGTDNKSIMGEEDGTEIEIRTEMEGDTERPSETVENPVYEEDMNVYGNTVGNLYNDGTFVYSEKDGCFYFQNIYAGSVVKTVAETGQTEKVIDKPLAYFNLYDEKLYGIEITDDYNFGGLYSYDLQNGDLEEIREESTSYLQVADGVMYYTDGSDNTLRKMDIESKQEVIMVDEAVYFPVVYKDIIVFQLDSDKESLYKIPRSGGEMVKLNDVHSYDPMIYRDKIYYRALDENEQYSVRRLNLDGSGEETWLSERVLDMNLYDGKFYYNTESAPGRVLCIDLQDSEKEEQDLQLSDCIRKALKETYGVKELQILQIAPFQFADSYMLLICQMDVEGSVYTDEYLYSMDTEEILIIPEYCIDMENPTEEQDSKTDGSTTESSRQAAAAQQEENISGTDTNQTTVESDKDAQARAVAQSIADSISGGSDLERVRAAAEAVAGYCSNATYTSADPDYRTAYGVFCKGVYTCAGATRALGLVLECMGYSWSHANENQWTHQWCELTMDGQTGWADGMGGVADYGACPFATGDTYTGPDGRIYYALQ